MDRQIDGWTDRWIDRQNLLENTFKHDDTDNTMHMLSIVFWGNIGSDLGFLLTINPMIPKRCVSAHCCVVRDYQVCHGKLSS